ncbi:hypothetical protein ACWDBD_03795 [Streptomyces sp. NPDC001118]
MDSTIWAALIGASATVLIQSTERFANSIKNRASARSAAQEQARAVAQEAIRAAFDLKVALAAVQTRWRDKLTTISTFTHAVARGYAVYQERGRFHGAATALEPALAYRQTTAVRDEATLAGPISRMTAATAQISMLEDIELRTAATAVMGALGALMVASGKPKSAAYAEADSRLNEALARLGDAARAYDGRPSRRRRRTRVPSEPQSH